ncbi:MAG: ATP-binding protein [Lachnospiraceae bacterium]|nr:ATP-binding protein [Lachnospiraceae bacterium]
MHWLTIDKLGPVQHCELPIRQYTVLTGFQAAGKSTVAKAIYFFRTLKNDIYQLIQQQEYLESIYGLKYASRQEDVKQHTLYGDFESFVRNKFLSTFGSSYSMDKTMRLCYQYNKDVEITISLTESHHSLTPNFVWVDYSPCIRKFLNSSRPTNNREALRRELDALFDDPYETVYIPAGRSVLTVLGGQFNYFYSTMDDAQKRLLDACTRDYLERVMQLRPQFTNGLEGLVEGKKISKEKQNLYSEALALVRQILKGKYTAADGEERIWIDSNHYVKINFASSGQQEIVWILNLLIYYFLTEQPVFFIIEEPESNLFPESQKLVVELISMIAGAGNAVLLTTHSLYVLGTVNNLLYANTVGKYSAQKTAQIISRCKWIKSADCTAVFMENGRAENCMDQELMQIDNSFLDQISHGINEEYDVLFAIEQQEEEES